MCLKLYLIQVCVAFLYFTLYFNVCHLMRMFTIKELGGKRNDMYKNIFCAKGSQSRVLCSQSHTGVQLQLYASVSQLFSHNPCGCKIKLKEHSKLENTVRVCIFMIDWNQLNCNKDQNPFST
jgi:hypothetical protein